MPDEIETEGERADRGEPRDVPLEVKHSPYGCMNCLWGGVECLQGSMYEPDTYNGVPSCKAYTYYD